MAVLKRNLELGWTRVARGLRCGLIVWFAAPVFGSSVVSSHRSISFRNDVMPVLSKAVCNSGTCHGNKNGKGGFKLSLRGQDPDLDYVSLTRDLAALCLLPRMLRNRRSVRSFRKLSPRQLRRLLLRYRISLKELSEQAI